MKLKSAALHAFFVANSKILDLSNFKESADDKVI